MGDARFGRTQAGPPAGSRDPADPCKVGVRLLARGIGRLRSQRSRTSCPGWPPDRFACCCPLILCVAACGGHRRFPSVAGPRPVRRAGWPRRPSSRQRSVRERRPTPSAATSSPTPAAEPDIDRHVHADPVSQPVRPTRRSERDRADPLLPPCPARAADFSKWTKARQKHFLQYDALPKAFVAQLDWLVANGYTTILPGDLASPLGSRHAVAAEAGDHHLRRRVEVVDQEGDAGAPTARHGRRVLSHPRRDQGRRDRLGRHPASSSRPATASAPTTSTTSRSPVCRAVTIRRSRRCGRRSTTSGRHPGQRRGRPGLDGIRRRRIRQDA